MMPFLRSSGVLAVALPAMLALFRAGAPHDPTASPATPASLPQERTSFAYVVGTDTIAVEQIAREGDVVTGDLVMRGQPRFVWKQTMTPASLGALSLEVFAANASATATPLQQVTFAIVRDTARIDIVAGGNTQTQAVATRAGAMVVVNPSVVQTAMSAHTALAAGASTFDALLVAGGQTLSGTLRRAGDTTIATLQGVELRARFDASGLPLEMSIPSQGVRVVRAAAGAATAVARDAMPVSYDAPAGAPYTAEHVRIPTGRGYELAGTLTRPIMSRLVGAVVTISGSGPQDRDSRIATVPGYALFREIADTLARRGIATLRVDDRGVGESGGREGAASITTATNADDVRSAVEFLRARGNIDPDRIALVGHSEGGTIAPIVASTDPRLRAIALLAGTAYDGRRILMYQNREAVNSMVAATPAQRDSIMATVPARLDSLAKVNAWIDYFMRYDPLVTARTVKQPVLILQGATDRQVTPEQADTLAAAFRAGGNRDVTVKLFAETNHLLLADPNGGVGGYAQLPDRRVRKEVLGTLADWLVRVLR